MTEPSVSIVIVTYEAREHTLRCLAALQEHVKLPYEAIVVDDGSTDGTVEAVRAQYPEARVHARPVNGGLVAGRNDALRMVRGRIVFMLDSDTLVHPGAVETLVERLDAQPGVGLVAPKLVGPDGELQLSSRRWPPFLIPVIRRGPYARMNPDPEVHRRHLMKDFDHEHERPVVWVSGAAQMWRADLPSRMGPYDRRVSSYGGEDLDWCLRVWGAGLQVHYVPDAVVVHEHQAVTNRNEFGRKAWRAFRDWYYLQWKHRRLRRDPRLAEANA